MTLQGHDFDAFKPSIFELLATSQLQSLIPPSLQYLLRALTQRYPRYLLRLFNRFDELYAFISLLIESYYLRTYSASFVEHFYSLRRARTPPFPLPLSTASTPSYIQSALRLRRRDIRLSLLTLVLLPYLKRKLDAALERHNARQLVLGDAFRRREETLAPDATISQRIKFAYTWFLKHAYPPIHAVAGTATLLASLTYLFDGSTTHDPLLWLLGLRMRRLSQEDWTAFEAAERQILSSSAPARGGAGRPGEQTAGLLSMASLRRLGPIGLRSLKLALPAAVFALKFLEWWHASNFASQLSRKRTENLNLPPPLVSGAPPSPAKSGPRDSSVTSEGKGKGKEKVKAASTKAPAPPPISASTSLPILTVSPPQAESAHLCPICSGPIVTPTACQTGYVFCYVCIFKWLKGEHDVQAAFMQGGKGGGDEAGWGEEEGEEGSREGRWESGQGRCAVTGRRVLGAEGGLRRIMV